MTQEYEKLSALVDGELNSDEAWSVNMIKSIGENPELNAKWRSYHLTRDIMRNDLSSDVSFKVAEGVAEALKNELPILAPRPSWKDQPVVAAVLPILKQSGQLAMVACVTALVIFGFQTYNQPEVSDPFSTAPPILGPQGGLAPVSLPSKTSSEERMSQLLEQRRQINALIQDHLRQQKLRSVANQAAQVLPNDEDKAESSSEQP